MSSSEVHPVSQDLSIAGKRRGKDDDRYLWPEMLRVISELRPAWVVGENVAGIVNMALDTVLSDLEGQGYSCQAFIIPACAVDAPHRRDRCAIVAFNPDSKRRIRGKVKGISKKFSPDDGRVREDVADTDDAGLQRLKQHGASEQATQPSRPTCKCGEVMAYAQVRREQRELSGGCGSRGLGGGSRGPVEPRLGGMADGFSAWLDEPLDVPRIANGIPNRVDRLKCLGNAVVPQQFYPIFKAIADIEEG